MMMIFHWKCVDNCTPLLFHQRVDSSNYFNRTWAWFKDGFGSKSCNYWLGNELLHQLTKDGSYKLRFDLHALASGNWYWAEYNTFIVDSEGTEYRLTVGGYSGTAGDGMQFHNNMGFSTIDRDNDGRNDNCALKRGGGFWWSGCGYVRITACTKSLRNTGQAWKSLPETSKELQMSRGWLLCPWARASLYRVHAA